MNEQKRDYYMIRTNYDLLEKKEVVAIGWNTIDFSKYDAENLAEVVRKEYYGNKSSSSISRKLNQIKRFKNLKEGDFVLIPTGSYIAFAKILKEEYFSEGDEFANQRKVEVLKNEKGNVTKVSRKVFTTALQNKFRMLGSIVLNISSFESDIEYIIKNNTLEIEDSIFKAKQDEEKTLRENIKDKIKKYANHFASGGDGFEDLLVELFRIEGYEATRLNKTSFPKGEDADIKAEKIDNFSETKFLIQAKNHKGTSGEKGIDQLIRALGYEQYEGYQGIFMTTADEVTLAAKNLANEKNIQIFKLDDIVDLIIDNIDALNDKTKFNLGLTMHPCIK